MVAEAFDALERSTCDPRTSPRLQVEPLEKADHIGCEAENKALGLTAAAHNNKWVENIQTSMGISGAHRRAQPDMNSIKD
jgi:hypothetical protein